LLANDFEGPVFERHPVIGTLKAQCRAAGAVMAAMSGSGSTVFGLFTSGAGAKAAARQLARSRAVSVDARVTRFRPRKKA
jgi:4-diphosphocytidyl-2-C-methyl-D-erythritol kinase